MKMSQHHAEQDDDLELCAYAEWEAQNGVQAMLDKWDKQRTQRSALQQLLAAEKASRERSHFELNEVMYGTGSKR